MHSYKKGEFDVTGRGESEDSFQMGDGITVTG